MTSKGGDCRFEDLKIFNDMKRFLYVVALCLLAAFAGTTCLGVGTWNAEYDAYWLYITAPTEGEELVLRYYSAALKQIFIATTTLPYHNDTQVGNAAAPYTPKWIVTPDRE